MSTYQESLNNYIECSNHALNTYAHAVNEANAKLTAATNENVELQADLAATKDKLKAADDKIKSLENRLMVESAYDACINVIADGEKYWYMHSLLYRGPAIEQLDEITRPSTQELNVIIE